MQTHDDGPLGLVEKKLPLLGRAVAGAIEKLTDDPDRFVFALFVIDTKAQGIAWTSDGDRAGMLAALSEFISRQSH